ALRLPPAPKARFYDQQGDRLMPRHRQVTTCRRSGGPLSKTCTCEHCALAVSAVCGAGEGSLTTDCPGEKVPYDRQQEVFEPSFDYTDERGWHLAPEGTR